MQLNEIQLGKASMRRALCSPRHANAGLGNGARRKLDSRDRISLSSTGRYAWKEDPLTVFLSKIGVKQFGVGNRFWNRQLKRIGYPFRQISNRNSKNLVLLQMHVRVKSRHRRILLEKVADSARKAVKLAEPYKPYGVIPRILLHFLYPHTKRA